MRIFLAMSLLASLAVAADPPVVSTAHRKVSEGWACGGNCAVSVTGESETTLGNDPPDVHLEDHGTLTERQSDRGGILAIVRRWNYAYRGTSTTGSARRLFDLHTDVSECTRTVETMGAGNAKTSKQSPCPGPPRHWKVSCLRNDVPVKGRMRPAWVCTPSEPLKAFGTEFPWVFGLDGPITTVVSGEPRPQTTYE